MLVQFLNFIRQNSSSSTSKNFDMPTTIFIQQIFHVFKKLHMTSLVAGDGNTLYIFLNSTFNYIGHAPVMTQVYNFGAFALENTAHDIDGCIMPIEQGCRSNDPYFIISFETHENSCFTGIMIL